MTCVLKVVMTHTLAFSGMTLQQTTIVLVRA